jgi:hypothetical protein
MNKKVFYLLAFLLAFGGRVVAQDNHDNFFIDIDKECFLIGTLDDYSGHWQTFTLGRDSSSHLIMAMKKTNNPFLQQALESADWYYQFVDRYYPSGKNLALLIQSLFGNEFPDLYMVDPGDDEAKNIRLHSASLTEVINGYYDYEPQGPYTTVFTDTIYTGILKPEKFQTVRQKLSFLAGAFLHDGCQTEERGYHLSMPNSLSKAKLCAKLLEEFECTNIVHEVFEDHIPCGNLIYFEPSETIRKLIEKVKTLDEILESDEAAEMIDSMIVGNANN